MNLTNWFRKKYRGRLWYGILIWGVIFTIIISLIIGGVFFFIQSNENNKSTAKITSNISSASEGLLTGQKEIKEILLTQKLAEWNVSKCSDILEGLGSNFSELKCVVQPITEPCISNPTIENDALFINNCDISFYRTDFPLDSAIEITVKPLWKLEDTSPHYLIDTISGQYPENNRVSLYVINGYLKYTIFNEPGTEEHTIKINLNNRSLWDKEKFNSIMVGWYPEQHKMFIILNQTRFTKFVGNINLNLNDSIFSIGSSVFGNNQGEGLYDDFTFWDLSSYSGSMTTEDNSMYMEGNITGVSCHADIPLRTYVNLIIFNNTDNEQINDLICDGTIYCPKKIWNTSNSFVKLGLNTLRPSLTPAIHSLIVLNDTNLKCYRNY